MAAKQFESYWEGYNSGGNHTGGEYLAAKSAWRAAIELVAAHSTSDNTTNNAIALLKELFADIPKERVYDKMDLGCWQDRINEVVAQQH